MSQFSRETKDLIAAGRLGPRMPQKDRARLKRLVLANVAAGSVTTSTAAAAAWLTLGAKITGALAIAGVVATGAVALTRDSSPGAAPPSAVAQAPSRPPPPPSSGVAPVAAQIAASDTTTSKSHSSPSSDSVPSARAPAEAIPADALTPPPLARATSAPRAPALHPSAAPRGAAPAMVGGARTSMSVASPSASPPVASPPPVARAAPIPEPTTSRSPLGEEARLLREADAALRAGDPHRAFALLDEHASRFPRGMLEPERSAERVLAFCSLGRVDEARAAAATFLTRHPSGPLAGRVATSCATWRR